MSEIKKIYSVYRHITPENKSYIGVTSLKINQRFQNGRGYKNCKRFIEAIEKYKWENIKHEVLYTTNDKKEAYKKEEYFIRFYKSNDERYGYNIEKGGLKSCLIGKDNSFYGKHHSKEQKEKWSKERKGKTAWNKNIFGKENKTNKMVLCIETGEIYEGTREVERKLKILHSSISRCCSSKCTNKTAGGYHWKYIEEV